MFNEELVACSHCLYFDTTKQVDSYMVLRSDLSIEEREDTGIAWCGKKHFIIKDDEKSHCPYFIISR